MSQILVPGDLRDTLSGVRDRSEIVDETGKVLGYFIPSDPVEVLSAPRPAESSGRSWDEIRADLEAGYFCFPTISEEEIQRRRQQKGGRTLAEIWTKLGVRQ